MTGYRTARGHGGVELAFRDEGEGNPVICLHGFPDTPDTWNTVAAGLRGSGLRVIVPALRGYEPSGIPVNGDYSIRALAEDVVSLLDHLSLESAAIVGHDWGASAGYAACALHPERVNALVALAIPPFPVFSDGLRERLARPHNVYLGFGGISDWWLRRDGFAEVERLYRKWSPHWRFASHDLAAVREAFAASQRSRAAVDYYAEKMDGRDAAELVRPIGTRTLIVYGSDEPPVRREAFDRATQAIGPGSRVVMLEDTGHWPHREAPDAVLALMLEFLGRPQA